MRRLADDSLTLRGRGVASAHRRAHVHVTAFAGQQCGANARERLVQIFMDVITEGFEWGNIEDARLILEISRQPSPEQQVKLSEKSGQRFARAGGGGNQRVRA